MSARGWWFLLFLIVFPVSSAFANERVPWTMFPARLEIGFELRMNSFETTGDKVRSGLEPAMSLGLGLTPFSWFSVHCRIEVSGAFQLEAPMYYRRQQQILKTRGLGSIGLGAAVGVHVPSRIAILMWDVSVRSYFAPLRGGIFYVDTGLSLASEPYQAENRADILQSIRFMLGVRFPLWDDFDTIFSHERRMPVVVFGIVLGY